MQATEITCCMNSLVIILIFLDPYKPYNEYRHYQQHDYNSAIYILMSHIISI